MYLNKTKQMKKEITKIELYTTFVWVFCCLELVKCSSHSLNLFMERSYELLVFACNLSSQRRANTKIHYNHKNRRSGKRANFQSAGMKRSLNIERYIYNEHEGTTFTSSVASFYSDYCKLLYFVCVFFSSTLVCSASVQSGKRFIHTLASKKERKKEGEKERRQK